MAQIEKLLVTQLISFINSRKDDYRLPCYITFGYPYDLTGEALWVQVLGGTRKTKKYLRGKYEGEFPFAVYYRLSGAAMGGIEAKMLIPHEQLAELFDAETPKFDGYTVQQIEMTKQPTIFSRSEDGTTVYQSVWKMTYKN